LWSLEGSLRSPREFIRALGLIKRHAARTNAAVGLLPEKVSRAIEQAAQELVDYDQASTIARVACERSRTVGDVAREMSGLGKPVLEALLDPARQTEPGLIGSGKCDST
jgi:fumarate hydratase class II